MPSGSRKRKAAKKKKELKSHTHEHDDAKSQDDKGSDGGEVSSPAHQDHHNNHHPFNEGDPSGVRPIASEGSDSMEKVPRGVVEEQKAESQDGGGVIEIEWSLKPEKDDGDGSSSSGSRGSSSSSSSSSDDESRAAEKKQGKETAGNLVAELSPVIETVPPVVPVSEETISVVESALVDNLLVPETVVPSTPPKIYEDNKVVRSSGDDSKASPSELKSDSEGYDGKGLPPSDVHIAQPSYVDPTKDSKTLVSPENQPPTAVHPVQKTPWWSCCGIFDVVSGSGR